MSRELQNVSHQPPENAQPKIRPNLPGIMYENHKVEGDETAIDSGTSRPYHLEGDESVNVRFSDEREAPSKIEDLEKLRISFKIEI